MDKGKYKTIDPQLLGILAQSDAQFQQLLDSADISLNNHRPLPLIAKRRQRREVVTLNDEIRSNTKRTAILPKLSTKSVADLSPDTQQTNSVPVDQVPVTQSFVRKLRITSLYGGTSRRRNTSLANKQRSNSSLIVIRKHDNLNVYSLELQKLMVSHSEVADIKKQEMEVKELKKRYGYLVRFPEEYFKQQNKILMAQL